jgi:hypothetical protein
MLFSFDCYRIYRVQQNATELIGKVVIYKMDCAGKRSSRTMIALSATATGVNDKRIGNSCRFTGSFGARGIEKAS